MTEFTDEYFINLTMKYDERDDTIYPKWAVWCAKSDDKYYIDGKDGHFFTHVRTDEEVNIEKTKHKLMEKIMIERIALDSTEASEEDRKLFEQYEEQYSHLIHENALTVTFKTFEEWKEQK